jgi:hypothetical protein
LTHALIVEGSDPATRHAMEGRFEPNGHELRAALDPVYKRATWGRRPEDVAAQRAVIGDVAGQR